MKVFLAGTAPFQELTERKYIPYLLESFYYFKDWQVNYIAMKTKDFLLDSGAFTFMSNAKSNANWDEYIESYANFINRNNIEKFFELDIDSIVGYKKVLEYRHKLESLTGKRCIPVWHKNRGVDDFKRICAEYDYVAIGGIVAKEIRPEHYKVFPALINEAHKNGAKIHGLGFTNINLLPMYHFDSVDSTSWTSGCRFGTLYHFNDGKMTVFSKTKGKRALREKANEHNLDEWIKFQKYAEAKL